MQPKTIGTPFYSYLAICLGLATPVSLTCVSLRSTLLLLAQQAESDSRQCPQQWTILSVLLQCCLWINFVAILSQ